MNPVAKTVMRGASKVAVGVYKASGGKLGGKGSGGVRVLLLTVAGRKTGQPHTTAVGYFDHEGGYLVVGSAGGLPHDPQWFRNLRAASGAEVRVAAASYVHCDHCPVAPGSGPADAIRSTVITRRVARAPASGDARRSL